MATEPVTVARIYLREGEHLLDELIGLLHDEFHVAGVTVLRGIAGFGEDGRVHSASLLALSLDLPLIVEFFEAPKRVTEIVNRLSARFEALHIVTWSAISH